MSRTTVTRWLSFALLLALAWPAPSQAQVAPTKTPIPINEDPGDPFATREERMRRQKDLIQRMMRDAEQRRKNKNQGGGAQAAPGQPEPGAAATPQPAPTPQLPAGEESGQPNVITQQVLQGQGAPGAQPGQPRQPQPPGKNGRGPASDLLISNEAYVPYVTMFLTPASIDVKPGETFATHVRLMNPDHLKIDAVRVLLGFPPGNLKVESIHQNELRPLLEGEPTLLAEEAAGRLLYEAKLSSAIEAAELPVITIVWKALEPIDDAWILPTVGQESSGAFYGAERITAGVLGADNTLAGARVRILAPAGGTPQGERFVEKSLGSIKSVLAGFPDQSLLRPPRLWIDQPPAGPVAVGSWHVIDLGIDNPDRMVFDEVRLAGSFDPAKLEVTDSDKRNTIGAGRNLLDGPFRELWQWDNLFSNWVDAQHGRFYYRMASTDLRQQPEGVIARLFVRVKAPVESPLIQWIVNPGAPESTPTTGVYLFGENIHLRGTAIEERDDRIVQGGQVRLPGSGDFEKANPLLYRRAGLGNGGGSRDDAECQASATSPAGAAAP